MKLLIIILTTVISINAKCQVLTTDRIIQIGDSVLSETIGSFYLEYYKLDTNSYYKTDRIFLKDHQYDLIPNRNIKGDFIEASIQYSIEYPEIEELQSTLYIILKPDKEIKTYTEDIPRFITENRSCDFLPKSRIVEIGDSLLTVKGIKINYYLHRDFQSKRFVWEINNIIRKCTVGKIADGLMETIIINPISGKILEHYKGAYGYVLNIKLQQPLYFIGCEVPRVIGTF